jgi:lincosamide nucleotidyltransferase A/C/D/E
MLMPTPSPKPSAPLATSRPPLFYLVTGFLNVIVWRMPLPRRVLARLSQTVYRSPPMPGEAVLEIVDALRAGGVRAGISGGWGVDALLQKRTRTHRDLDLVIDHRDMQQAVEVLRDLGYWEWYRMDSDEPLESRIVVHNHDFAGRAVDLHPVERSGMPIEFTAGAVEGRPVPCITLGWQLKTHSGYRVRERADLALLGELGEAVPTMVGLEEARP